MLRILYFKSSCVRTPFAKLLDRFFTLESLADAHCSFGCDDL